MKTKLFTSFGFAFVMLALVLSFVSAAPSFSSLPTSLNTSSGTHSYSIDVSGEDTVSFSQSEDVPFTINFLYNGTLHEVTLSYNVQETSMFDFEKSVAEDYFITLNATNTTDGSSTIKSVNFDEIDFSYYDGNSFDTINDDYLEIKKIELSNVGFGDDDEWYLLDQIEGQITVKAGDKDVDLNSVSVEWGLYDKNSGNWVIEVDEEDEIDLNGGESEDITFAFTLDDSLDVDLDELEDATLVFYARATGEADPDSDYEGTITDGEVLSHSDSETDIDLRVERDFVILDNLTYNEEVGCGDNIQVTADAWNIGYKQQDDVSVLVKSSDLGINQRIQVGDIDEFDEADLPFTFNFEIPGDTEEGDYTIEFIVYDDDLDVYEDNDRESVSYAYITVSGGCSYEAPVSVSADLASDAVEGEELSVSLTLTNTGDSLKSYELSLEGSEGWADSSSLSQSRVSILSGSSQVVTATFNVKEGSYGQQVFYLDMYSDGELVASQPVSVTIEENKSVLSGIMGENSYIWLIGIVNVILIVIIILVAVRVARKQ